MIEYNHLFSRHKNLAYLVTKKSERKIQSLLNIFSYNSSHQKILYTTKTFQNKKIKKPSAFALVEGECTGQDDDDNDGSGDNDGGGGGDGGGSGCGVVDGHGDNDRGGGGSGNDNDGDEDNDGGGGDYSTQRYSCHQIDDAYNIKHMI